MLLQADRLSSQFPLRPLSVLVFHLLLTHSCRGQSQLMGPPQPIVATLGQDVILPCHLEPEMDVTADTLEWTRSDLNPIFVNVLRAGQDLQKTRNPSYKGRTLLFRDELKHGNISLKLSEVQLSDLGTYTCDIPLKHKQSSVKLVFASGPSSPPLISLSGLDGQSGGVVLQCESAGWYPEPEVLWLDAEGKLLSAGPPETVRGPDDLYTVSSRVTVEKRPSSSFTCRVQHHNTTRTTQTQIHVPDDFFKLQSRSSSIIIGLAVSLAVCILLMLAVSFFFVWREHIFKTKRKSSDEVDKGEKKNQTKTKDQFLSEGERGQLMKPGAVQMEALKGKVENKSKPKNQSEQQLLEEQRRREEAEKEVQTLKEQLQNKKKEVESKQSELQDLHAEKQRNQNQLQSLKGDLENKNREVETIQTTINSISTFDWASIKEEQKKKAEAEQEVETLEKKLESRQKETDTNITECEVKEAEVQQLQEEVQRMETSLQTLMETINMELERSPAAEASSSSSSPFKLKILSRNKSQEEKRRKRREEEELKEEMKRRREEAEEEVSILKEKLQNETREVERLKADLQRGGEERRRREEEMKEEMTERKEEADQKLADLGKIEKELKETQSLLEIQRTENMQLKTEFQAGQCEGSDGSRSVEPPCPPPYTQTSDPGFNIQFNQQHKCIRLMNTSTEDKDLGEWQLDLQVNNNNPIMFTFDRSFKLRAGGFVNMWVKGHGPNRSPTDLEWKYLKPWCSGDSLKFSLYSHTGEIQYERCVTFAEIF